MQQGDIGVPIEAELRLDGELFTFFPGSIAELWIRQPSGRLLRRLLDVGNPVDGIVKYYTVAGDLAEFGRYRFQVRAVLSDGQTYGFATKDVDVQPSLYPPTTFVLPDPVAVVLEVPEPAVP